MKKLYLLLILALPTLLFSTPNAPLNISFSNVASNSLTILWQDNSHAESGYKIFRDGVLIKTVGKSTTSYTDTGLQSLREYTYTIKATDDIPQETMVNSTKNIFGTNGEPLTFNLYNLAGGDLDWLGIFASGAAHNRDNLLAWTYTNGLNNGEIRVNSIFAGSLPTGEYQIVSFYNDSYNAESVSHFGVTDTLTIQTQQDVYTSNDDTIVVDISNAPQKENNLDWIGIFKEDAPSERAHLYTWSYTNGQTHGQVTLNGPTLAEGRYEARFLLDDGYGVATTSSFTVQNAVNYGQRGDAVVNKDIDGDEIKIYYPEGVENAPIVLVLAAGTIDGKLNDMMDFIASNGYYVIGMSWNAHDTNTIVDQLALAHNDNNRADTTKVALIGHSQGAAVSYKYMSVIKAAGYASSKRSIISLDGWFAFYMTPTDMQNLNTSTLIMAFGGADALDDPNDFFRQNPKINLATYRLLGDNEKVFLHIPGNEDHLYPYNSNYGGNGQNFLDRVDMLKPLHAFLNYTLTDDPNAATIALQDNSEDVVAYLAGDPLPDSFYERLDGQAPGGYRCDDTFGTYIYDYCNLDNIISYQPLPQ